jgi:hypothetical protein
MSVIKSSQLMMNMGIIAVCSEIHTNTKIQCGQNVELLNVKLGGKYSDHWAVKGEYTHHELKRIH